MRRRAHATERRGDAPHGDRSRAGARVREGQGAPRLLPIRDDRAPMARALILAGLRPGDAADRLRPPPRPTGREGRRADPGTDRGDRAAHRERVGHGSSGPSSRRQGRRAHPDQRSVHDRGRRRRQQVREAGRDPARRLASAGDRGPPLLPHPLPPGPLVRVLARSVGGRHAVARLRMAVPRRRGPGEPRRRAPQHLQGLQTGLRAAAVRCVRHDAPGRLGDRRSARRGPRALGSAPDELQPHAAWWCPGCS